MPLLLKSHKISMQEKLFSNVKTSTSEQEEVGLVEGN